eukprot:4044670-Heterocapsa_arctica.AAC.1
MYPTFAQSITTKHINTFLSVKGVPCFTYALTCVCRSAWPRFLQLSFACWLSDGLAKAAVQRVRSHVACRNVLATRGVHCHPVIAGRIAEHLHQSAASIEKQVKRSE